MRSPSDGSVAALRELGNLPGDDPAVDRVPAAGPEIALPLVAFLIQCFRGLQIFVAGFYFCLIVTRLFHTLFIIFD
jgi:hypothetical protein